MRGVGSLVLLACAAAVALLLSTSQVSGRSGRPFDGLLRGAQHALRSALLTGLELAPAVDDAESDAQSDGGRGLESDDPDDDDDDGGNGSIHYGEVEADEARAILSTTAGGGGSATPSASRASRRRRRGGAPEELPGVDPDAELQPNDPSNDVGAATPTSSATRVSASTSRRPSVSRIPARGAAALPPAGRAPVLTPLQCPRRRKYIHLLNTREGMSAWTHIVYELLWTAKLTGRTLVEPCVAGGQLLPCTPGKVLPVPESLAMAEAPITPFSDPLNVPAFAEHCLSATAGSGPRADEGAGLEGAASAVPQRAGRTYPLRLYMDIPRLRASYPHIISFDEWVACELTRGGRGRSAGAAAAPDEVAYIDGRIVADVGYCVMRGTARASEADLRQCTKTGNFRFRKTWTPGGHLAAAAAEAADAASLQAGLGINVSPTPAPASALPPGSGHMLKLFRDVLMSDKRRNMFLYNVWRGCVLRRIRAAITSSSGPMNSRLAPLTQLVSIVRLVQAHTGLQRHSPSSGTRLAARAPRRSRRGASARRVWRHRRECPVSRRCAAVRRVPVAV